MLTFIGKGSAFNEERVNNSAYFTDDSNKNLFIIDCGNTVFNQIKRINLIEEHIDYKIYILVTHIHADHVGSIGTLIEFLYYNYNKKLNIISMTDTGVGEYLSSLKLSNDLYNYKPAVVNNNGYLSIPSDFYKFEFGDIEIFFIKTKHVNNLNTYSLLITKYMIKERRFDSIYYTSDTIETPEQHLRKLEQKVKNEINRNISCYYTDVSFKEENNVHLTYDRLLESIKYSPMEWLKDYYRDYGTKIKLMHIDDNEINIYEKEKELLSVLKEDNILEGTGDNKND
ncbi:RNaseZ-like protein [Staphylococcus phage Machias]|nr:RNaseZ-like protein [Staphylococcus phage Machias]